MRRTIFRFDVWGSNLILVGVWHSKFAGAIDDGVDLAHARSFLGGGMPFTVQLFAGWVAVFSGLLTPPVIVAAERLSSFSSFLSRAGTCGSLLCSSSIQVSIGAMP
jgi:hypothetical protein